MIVLHWIAVILLLLLSSPSSAQQVLHSTSSHAQVSSMQQAAQLAKLRADYNAMATSVTSLLSTIATQDASITAQATELAAAKACGDAGMIYGPTHPLKDGNGCVSTFQVSTGGSIKVTGIVGANNEPLRDVNGAWVRTYGTSGWYNQTHNGGWFMQDSTYIRAYANKTVYSAGDLNFRNGYFSNAYFSAIGKWASQLNTEKGTLVCVGGGAYDCAPGYTLTAVAGTGRCCRIQ